ncbi:VOC family protein [Candidatus Roizmanbacteria bacterium]|nr:VOC family protein [Candidatus Roizmanbacteria bacterium]
MKINPLLVVSDIKTSTQFYESLLGFEKKTVVKETDDVRYVDFKVGETVLMLVPEQYKDINKEQVKGNGVELYFDRDDFLDFYRNLKTKNVAFEKDIYLTPWTTLQFHLKDPDGYTLIFSDILRRDKKYKNVVEECVAFLKTLSSEKWEIQVDDNWTVKDIVAHLINWEGEVMKVLPEVWKSGVQPWFMDTGEYEEFNQQAVEKYRSVPPQNLIEVWEKIEAQLQQKIQMIGEEKLNARRNEFDWVFDDDEKSHVLEHLYQIKMALGKI